MKIGYVIAIDGPSGAGKSSVARDLAKKLGYRFIDTGAMYRAAALAAERAGVDPHDLAALERLFGAINLRQETVEGTVLTFLDGENVSAAIRTADMGLKASAVSALPQVRERLTALQRRMGAEGGVVMEGRDIGTVVFPDADFKFFLTASVEERARRRRDELVARGETVDPGRMLREIGERDRQDSTRALAPLRRPPDALEIDSTAKTLEQVVDEICKIVRSAGKG